jgi:proline iminopeptidase
LLPLQPCADRFTLFFYDHRCNGRSTGTDVSSMTWENLTADAEALRQTLGFDRWTVLGHSFGGMVALEYALRYPHSLSHLLLMDTCGDTRWVQCNAPEILAKRGYSAATVQAARRFFNGQLTPEEVMPAMLKFGSAYYDHPRIWDLPHIMVSGSRVKMQPEALIFGFSQLLTGWTVMDRLSEIKGRRWSWRGVTTFSFRRNIKPSLRIGYLTCNWN